MSRTRIVRWLRVVLPLLALVILSTMFMFSGQPEDNPQIPYSGMDPDRLARERRMVAPQYSGVTDDGGQLSLRAQEAAPGGASGAGAGAGAGWASDLQLDWQRPDGLRARLTAPGADVDGDTIALSGGVRMTTSTGWTLDAPRVEAATDRSHLLATDGVQADAPFGRITADRMELAPDPEAGNTAATGTDGTAASASDGGPGAAAGPRPSTAATVAGADAPGDAPSVLTFSGGVRLIYQP
jgi:lipopolysaccharide export system protein LptC